MTNGGLRTLFSKGNVMETVGTFCTVVVEEDFPEEIHSPTDSSEDSVEVKVEAISFRNKRKCAEPRRVQEGPLKKRMCLQAQVQPFRPWSRESAEQSQQSFLSAVVPTLTVPQVVIKEKLPPVIPIRVPDVPHAYFRPPSPIRRSPSPIMRPPSPIMRPQSPIRRPPSPVQPVALIKKRETSDDLVMNGGKIKTENAVHRMPLHAHMNQGEDLRIPLHPPATHLSTVDADMMLSSSAEAFPRLQQTRKEQRNYKNMTRERRIEANARERTRVHTISAAFDTLRRSIPAYSHSQKLSKLSVLRVACSYIMTLSNMLADDQTEVAQCVEQVTKTIQREGKLRKKKDDTD